MPTASRPTFLRRFAGAQQPPRVPDLADMGTAFGLDCSLDQADEPHQAATLSPPHAVTPVAPWRMWLGRKLGA